MTILQQVLLAFAAFVLFIFQQMFLFYFTKSYTRVPLCGTGKHGDTMQN